MTLSWPEYRIIDISQPVGPATACFPGDVPFSRQVTVDYSDSGLMNLTAFTMSPHVGTHADAPVHLHGSLEDHAQSVASLPLEPFLGPVRVVDVSPFNGEITVSHLTAVLPAHEELPPRILFKTAHTIRHDVFEEEYAWFSVELVHYLADRGVRLMGLDTPSVDHIRSKTLDTHHALIKRRLSWLENLDLTAVSPGVYALVALPLKLTALEASPVRAVLLASSNDTKM